MDLPDLHSGPRPDSPSADLQTEVRLLRAYLVATLSASLVIALCFDLLLYRMDRSTRGQIEQSRQIRAELERQVEQPVMVFLNQVSAFAATHQDVSVILARYGVRPPTAPPAIAPAVTQPPAAQPGAPKSATPAPAPASKK
jgi:hypothetical protein